MSLLGMPWIVINLGCEMVYILEQRLKAQGVAPDKALKVLQDIVRTLFDRSFVREKLFVPQEMYSMHSTRKIFDRLAHSSIMRLSESSMDKLFDLMVMGAKYQLFCSSKLDDMIQVTLRHLGTVQAILTSALAATNTTGELDSTGINLIAETEEATVRMYGTLSMGELILLRHTLARFFQDKRVKVSLFLAEGIQLQSGKLVVPGCLSDQVGIVRTFDAAGRLESEEKLMLDSQKADVNEFFCHPVLLGDNLYNKDRPKVVPPLRDSEGTKDRDKDKQQSTATAGVDSQPTRYAEEEEVGSSRAAKELDLLAALVHVSKPAADSFKLNLFGDAFDDGVIIRGQPTPLATAAVSKHDKNTELQFGGEGRDETYLKAVQNVLEGVELDDDPVQQKKSDVGDDLLELMDSVT